MRTSARLAASGSSAGCGPSQSHGRANRTRRPSPGAKQRSPVKAAGLSRSPNPPPSLAASAGLPTSSATAAASSSRVSSRPASARGMAASIASASARSKPVVAQPGRHVMARAQAAERGHVAGQLRGGQQVQRAAHGPRLDQRPLVPQGAAHPLAVEPVDARPERQLRGREDLGVQPGDAADHVERAVGGRALGELLALHPPGEHGRPLEPRRAHRSAAASPSSRSTSTQSRHSPSSRPWRRCTPTSVKPAARCTARLAALEANSFEVTL